MGMTSPTVLEIDGTRFDDLEGFWNEVSRQLIPGADWGRNLDAFNDTLRGGQAQERQNPGHPAYVRSLAEKLGLGPWRSRMREPFADRLKASTCADDVDHPAVALFIAQGGGRLGEVAHDVDHRAHLPRLLVKDLHARAPLAEHRTRSRGLREAVSKSRVWKFVSWAMRSSLSVTPAASSAVSVERADHGLGSLGHAELPERARREVEHGHERACGLLGGLTCGRQGLETRDGFVG